MPLILTMTQTKGAGRGNERQIRTLAAGSLSIGRAPGNDWVLPDPDQHLSRTHCMIAFEGGRYMLTDLSTNGLFINGAREPTTRNSRFVLTDGDTVQLGTYQLAVAETDDAAGHGAFGAGQFITPRGDALAPPSRGLGEGPLDIDPLDDPLGGSFEDSAAAGFQHPMPHMPPVVRAEDPFDLAEGERRRTRDPDEDLFHGKISKDEWQGPAQHDRGDMGSQAFTPPRAITPVPVNVNDIDFDDLLGDLMPTPAPHPLAPPPPTPQAPPMPHGLAESLDDLLGDFPPTPTPGSAPVPTEVPVGAAGASQPARQPPAASLPAAPPPAASQSPAPPAARPAPPTAQPPGPPSPAQSSPAASPFDAPAAAPAVPPARAAAPATADTATLLTAFAEGAGLPQLDLLATGSGGASADPAEVMRTIGGLFAAFAAGTREVLMSRAEIKHEMRVEQTMMRARDNNALKFSISAQEALAALLQPNRPGYKAPLAAIEEAFNDIRSHEMAVMAGLQTALLALLKRFDPEALESRLQRGMLDAVLPGARKARFWELFCATYKDIASEAQDDFHSIFGREFARAYDAQIRKL